MKALLLIATLLMTACGSMQYDSTGGASKVKGEEEQTRPVSASLLIVPNYEYLPYCDYRYEGSFYYVENVDALVVCRGWNWKVLKLGRGENEPEERTTKKSKVRAKVKTEQKIDSELQKIINELIQEASESMDDVGESSDIPDDSEDPNDSGNSSSKPKA